MTNKYDSQSLTVRNNKISSTVSIPGQVSDEWLKFYGISITQVLAMPP